MSTTKILHLADGSAVLETFDYRSEFAFDDFALWLSEQLNVLPINGAIGEDMEPFTFNWNGSIFEASWNDEHGCFIKAGAAQQNELERMQIALSQ